MNFVFIHMPTFVCIEDMQLSSIELGIFFQLIFHMYDYSLKLNLMCIFINLLVFLCDLVKV